MWCAFSSTLPGCQERHQLEYEAQTPAIVFTVYCLNKYVEKQLKKFSGPIASGQNMLSADGIVANSDKTQLTEWSACLLEMSKATFPVSVGYTWLLQVSIACYKD